MVPAGVAKSFSEMIWERSILLLVYEVGARSDVTEGVWTAVEKGRGLGTWAGGTNRRCPRLFQSLGNNIFGKTRG